MRTLKHALHGIIQTCWISHPSLRLELATQQELLYLSFCFSNFVNLLFTLNYICWLNCNQRTVEGIKLQRCWLYLCTSLLAQIKWPISPPIMAPFLKSLSLPGALPRSELIAEIVPSFHPSKYSKYLCWCVFAGVLVSSAQRSGRQGSFSYNSYQFTGLEVRCSIHTHMSPVVPPALSQLWSPGGPNEVLAWVLYWTF